MFPGDDGARSARGSKMQTAECRNGLRSRRRLAVPAVCVLLFALLTGCHQKMANQPINNPLEPSDFFPDGMSARPRVPGTVARGELTTNPFMESGKVNGQLADGYPFAVTGDVLDRGQQRFNIYCAPCHGRVGDGNGMIPARGYRRPPSFHTDALRSAKTGHFFDVMTNGFGSMPPYNVQVSVSDRWAIVAYIRALQRSQNGRIEQIPSAQREGLQKTALTGEGR